MGLRSLLYQSLKSRGTFLLNFFVFISYITSFLTQLLMEMKMRHVKPDADLQNIIVKSHIVAGIREAIQAKTFWLIIIYSSFWYWYFQRGQTRCAGESQIFEQWWDSPFRSTPNMWDCDVIGSSISTEFKWSYYPFSILVLKLLDSKFSRKDEVKRSNTDTDLSSAGKL